MGELTLPDSSLVYVDTQILIYSVEKHPTYWSLLRPLWLKSATAEIQIISSELALLETLVAPLRNANSVLTHIPHPELSHGTIRQTSPLAKPVSGAS